ncbi:MAG: hypothetical protein ABIK83_04815 [Candidatus Zixiibacteriota bacterium]
MSHFTRRILLLVVAIVLVAGDANAQIVFGSPPVARARIVYQSWTVDNDITGDKFDVSQWYFPVYGFVPIAEDWEIHVSSATAGTQSDSSGSDVSINGLNDTRISVLHSLFDDRLLLGAGLNIPTGKATLELDQSGLGQVLTTDFLNFPAKNYGEGFGLYLESAYARQTGKLTLGVGAGYLLSSSYSPIRGSDSYDPGDKFVAGGNLGVSHDFGNAYAYLRYSSFGNSTQDGIDVYKIGSITEVAFGTTFIYEQFESDAGVRLLFRQADSRTVSGELLEFEHKNYGNDLRIFTALGYRLRKAGKASVLIDYKSISANGFESGDDEYAGKANIFGFGAGFEKSVTDEVDLSASFKSFSGSADDGNLDLSGLEIGLAVRVSL